MEDANNIVQRLNYKERRINMNKETFKDKKWNEYPFSYPPVNTLVLVEYDTARQEWYKGFVLALGDDAYGEFCQFQWLEGPRANQTAYYYTPESFKSLLSVENKEEKISLNKKRVLTIF